jgi:hypothetical protein
VQQYPFLKFVTTLFVSAYTAIIVFIEMRENFCAETPMAIARKVQQSRISVHLMMTE